ncbi:GTP 3',8-cyclase MoaA [Flagellimonas zhangzhouensis]|uniref:GTP 3',8-cyclase n=1 Tax=Flagellimonas zhangzhouensis TaxID=1073328 RepID=A0A1H2S614_9FLAO|nr:GTP 3',8-cyclase MoaA [Allomuricauda zhangzhouensis]SDQ71084.1 cyclic pyranopterin monophosphate synthase subunit MoaA [Allomuricauda zhangzhouensis]SDW27051.1 cyclic pyranopterin monophosphate synthase subunit MoaA [Allomuricauda zhangzhouensis]
MIDYKPQIIDNFGRPHTYLRISLTDRCNLRCFYCMPEEGIELMEKPSIMTLEEIIEMTRTFRDLGVDTVRLTGGEPLVRKNFGFLVEELAKLGVTLKLTTNGIVLDKYLELFDKIGLRKINFSLDTLDKAKSIFITKRDYYERIMRNLEMALDLDMQIKLNVVLIKGVNENEINDFIALTQHKDLSIKFIEFMPFKGNKWDWSKGVSKEEILQTIGDKYGEIEALNNPKHSTSTNFKVKDHKGSFGIVSTITNPFCDDCNRIRLTADGNMKNCLFATSETDLLTPLRNGEQINNTILEAIKSKKHSRDGMELKMDAEHYEQNRSMISIGG